MNLTAIFYTIYEDSQVQTLQSAKFLDFVLSSFPFVKMTGYMLEDQESERKLGSNKINLINNFKNHQ